MRVTDPSAKMQTTWPASSSFRADWIAAVMARGPPRSTGIVRSARSTPAEGPMLVVRTPDHEPHVTVPGGPSDQKSVHQGDVVGHQQNAALRRDMLGAEHPDAVQDRDQAADGQTHQSQRDSSSDQRYHTNSVSREATEC